MSNRPQSDSIGRTLRVLQTNANAMRMNELMFAHMDYAVVGYRI